MSYKGKYSIYELGDEVGRGGEATIYKIKGNNRHIAKIFKDEKRTSFQQKKIEAMLDTKVDKAVYEQVTWPVDILFENNKFAGYVMNKVENSVELFDLNGPRYAKDITNLDRVAIAQNICSAVNAVHSTGNVVGDMNPKNVLVNPTSLRLTLVDTDSFVIKKNSREFRCGVGRPEYIAPELSRRLHGIGLDTISLPSYTRQTDNFALAIHIFSLLMDSYHPFSCRILDVARESVVCPSKLENIESGFSPFFKQENDFDIPKTAPRVNILPKDIQALFKKAFIDGYKNPSLRPTPEEWRLALMDLYNDMNNKKIKYFIKGKVNKIKQKLNK